MVVTSYSYVKSSAELQIKVVYFELPGSNGKRVSGLLNAFSICDRSLGSISAEPGGRPFEVIISVGEVFAKKIFSHGIEQIRCLVESHWRKARRTAQVDNLRRGRYWPQQMSRESQKVPCRFTPCRRRLSYVTYTRREKDESGRGQDFKRRVIIVPRMLTREREREPTFYPEYCYEHSAISLGVQ
ncbi:hypothetical protein IF2G_10086 [Cordyceps javanica]|nr:hypothetical protein IF2G_10086 [Cordyceps javanica]